MPKAIIIGGGIGGLSAAIYLAREGYQVEVYEKNEQLGGRISVFEKDGFRRDMGPSWYLMPDLFEKTFQERGENIHDYLNLALLDPMYRIYYKDTAEMVDVHQDLERNRQWYEKVEPGSTASLRRYIDQAKVQYDIAMEEFVPFNYDSIFDFFKVRLALKAWRLHIFGTISSYVRRFFSSPFLQKIVQYPMVFLGTPPAKSPALYNIMSHVDFGLGVWYPQGGLYTIITALVQIGKKYNVVYHTHAEVNKIVVEQRVAKGIILADDSVVGADIVVANADMHRVETHLLDLDQQTYPERYWDKKIMAPSGFVVYLGIKGKVENIKHHTLIFSQDREQNFREIFDEHAYPSDPSLYICCPSKTDTTVAPEGDENLFILVPFPARTDMDAAAIEAYKIKIYTCIEEAIGEKFSDRIVSETLFSGKDFESRYHAYKGTALGLAHTFNQTAIFRPNTYSKKVAGLYYVGGYTNPGIGMPMCLISGKLVKERVLQKEGKK